jgi:hypothetical protein
MPILRGFPALLLAAAGVTGLTDVVRASDLASSPVPVATAPASSPWEFSITGYGWLAGLNGDVGTLPPLPPIHVNASFRDILKNLDMGLMGAAEARYGNFLFIGDAMYVKLSTSEKFKTRIASKATLETTNFIGTAAVGYRILANPAYRT